MEHLQGIASKTELEEVASKNRNKLIVLYFRADWAPQCKQVDDLMPDLVKDKELAHANFFKVEAEQAQDLSQQYGITSVPTFNVLLNKESVAKVEGVNVPELVRKLKGLQTKVDLLPLVTPPANQDFMGKLKEITSKAPCVLLLEGTPEEPIGEHNQEAVEILKRLQVPFTGYNVENDTAFRDQILARITSPAPASYPLLFVNGVLVGGIEKMKKMVQSGEMEKLVLATDLTKRLDKLINEAPVMVFMKGTPESPCCGFSRTLVEILRKAGITYKSFNILADEEVRQGLKKHSNWPTYPQVYVKGSLVGGLDIIKELDEADELVSTLQG